MSITGPYGFIGSSQREAFDIMFDEINKKGGISGTPLGRS
jgi:ABC-type branched-subunit amino acid transport system substrate-binding protein